jgi:SPP1 gp7 family putative phage head morphogenesis protein
MRRYERQFEQAAARALDKLRRDLVRGITDENVHELTTRLNDEAITRPFQDAIVAQLQAVALAGSAFGREQVERGVFGVRKALEVGAWELANNAAFQWAMDYGYDLVRNIETITRERIGLEVADYIRNSQPIDTLFRRLTAGWLFSPERARLIAVTEVTRAYAEGNRQAWKASGVIERKRWNTNNDEIVAGCPICAPLHGRVVDLEADFGDGIDDPPAHPRCRCWITPVIEDVARPSVVTPQPEVLPEPEPVPVPVLDADGFPVDIDGLEEVQSLGGSTGAMLVRDPVTGKQYVMKRGASADHVRRELVADDTYRALGARVPAARIYETPGGPVKLAEFVEGKSLKSFMRPDGTFPDDILREVRESFAADALLGNRDVIGLDYDNIFVDAAGRAWRIDNGGSLDFRAQGGRKAFDGFPLELWTMRDRAINAQTTAVFGGMDYGELMGQVRALGGRRGAALDLLPDELRDAFGQRLDRLEEAARQYDELIRDGWRRNYPDRFTYFGMRMEQQGIFDRLPKRLSNQGVEVYDENGVLFDNMRGSRSIMHEVRQFINDNGGDYGMVEYYMGQQAGSSWSNGAQSLKHWLTTKMDIDESQVYWYDRAAARNAYERTIERFGEDTYTNTWQAFHTFNYNMLQRTQFPGNYPEEGVVELIRTEAESILRNNGLKRGAKGVTMPRGLAESSSIFQPVTVGGSEVTIQQVPHSRVLGMYFYERTPGANYGAFYGDRENEFVFIPYGIKFNWKK